MERFSFPISCQCECSKEINDPELKQILPIGYKYALCEMERKNDQFECRFRINLTTKSDALKWLDEYQASSNTSYTKDRTFPEDKTRNIFKVTLKCHHNTRPRAEVKIPHYKHTNCPARLVLTVKNTSLSRKYKSSDIHLKDYPTYVILRHVHNHEINSADALKYHEPNQQIESMKGNIEIRGCSVSNNKGDEHDQDETSFTTVNCSADTRSQAFEFSSPNLTERLQDQINTLLLGSSKRKSTSTDSVRDLQKRRRLDEIEENNLVINTFKETQEMKKMLQSVDESLKENTKSLKECTNLLKEIFSAIIVLNNNVVTLYNNVNNTA